MAKRGRRQLPGLRFHANRGQWYRRYDGKHKYFGPRGVAEDDPKAKVLAEREWHLHETKVSIPMLVPMLTPEKARDELHWSLDRFAAFFDDEEDIHGRITDEIVAEWHRVAGNQGKQRDILIRLGIDPQWIWDDPDLWSFLDTGGVTVNPHYCKQSPEHEEQAWEALLGLEPGTWRVKRDNTPTCKKVVDYYLAFLRQHKAAVSYVTAHEPLQHWLRFVGSDTRIGSLTHDHFVTYRDQWWTKISERLRWEATQPKPIPRASKRKAPGKAPDTANKHIRLIKAAFRRYKRDKGLDVPGLADGLDALQQKGGGSPTDIPIFKPEHIHQMLDKFDLYWQTIILLALNMAGSNTDIDGVQWHHIDFDTAVLDYPRTKNNRPRRLPLWQRTLDALSAYRKAYRSTSYIFLNRHGGRLITYGNRSKTDNLSRNFRKHMEKLGLPHSFAAFRKSTSTTAKQHTDEGTILMILGDAPPGMWGRYVMAVPEVVAKPIAKVEEHYFGNGASVVD